MKEEETPVASTCLFMSIVPPTPSLTEYQFRFAELLILLGYKSFLDEIVLFGDRLQTN